MDVYDEMRPLLIAAGTPAEKVDEYITEQRREDSCLDRCECPKCRAPLSKVLDERQDGPCRFAGKWFRYACPACPYRVDRKEPVGEN